MFLDNNVFYFDRVTEMPILNELYNVLTDVYYENISSTKSISIPSVRWDVICVISNGFYSIYQMYTGNNVHNFI